MGIWSFSLLLLGMLRVGEGRQDEKDCFNPKESNREHLRQTVDNGIAGLSKSQGQWATNSAFTVIWLQDVGIHGNPNMFKK